MTNYTETIMKYAATATHVGLLDNPDGTGEVGLGKTQAGSRLAVRFTLRVDDQRAVAVRFQVFGCGFTIAACAAAAQLAEGQSLPHIEAIAPAWVDAVLGGLPADRGYCADLAVEALQAAVQSARAGTSVATRMPVPREDHGPDPTANDPIYRALTRSPSPPGVAAEDRHLFACLIASAARESLAIAGALGLAPDDLAAILATFFPDADPNLPHQPTSGPAPNPPEINQGVLALLLAHVPRDERDRPLPAGNWLARIIAARAAHPGHLWVAMGLFQRPELSRAIHRHLPGLARANSQGMRWKRFLFKQVCEMGGGTLCKAPDCGACSDYALCFPDH